eukprot:scaffold247726_cov18-Tisochrysis_lutea.AAC.1
MLAGIPAWPPLALAAAAQGPAWPAGRDGWPEGAIAVLTLRSLACWLLCARPCHQSGFRKWRKSRP